MRQCRCNTSSTRIRSLIVLLSACGRGKSTVPLGIVPVPKSSIEALTTREAALRSEVALLETEHAVKAEALEALLLEVRQERGKAEREQATFLDLLAARKILEEEHAHLRQLN
jgi:hypothetical protein